MWEGVLFHLALLLCARQVVKRREGVSERAEDRERESKMEGGRGWKEREGEREGCRMKRKMEKEGGGEDKDAVWLSFSCQSK